MALMNDKSHEASPTKARILIVDDHPIVRSGLVMLINQEPDLVVCCEAEDPAQALKVVETAHPDLALVDLSLKGRDGIELIKDLRQRMPQLPILVLSMLDEKFYAERALRAGARGYVMKHEATTKLLTAIRRVLGGEVCVSDTVVTGLLNKLSDKSAGHHAAEDPVVSLSDRELTVFQMIGQGITTGRIASQLHISPKTVETYRMHIKEKLNLETAADLIQYAVKWSSARTTS